MAGFSTARANAILTEDLITNPIWVALHTADPTDAGSAGEIVGNGYNRVQGTFGAPAGGSAANTATVEFPAASAAWGEITHVSLWTASSGGTMKYSDVAQVPKTVDSGDVYRIPVGSLVVTLT